jgi:hypothetical protein
MPIPDELWKKYVKAYLERIADRRYQDLVWFNRPRSEWKDEISSPGDLVNGLFCDSLFDEFVVSPHFDFTSDQRASAQSFADLLTKFSKATPDFPDPKQVIDDPVWGEVREAGKALLLKLAL